MTITPPSPYPPFHPLPGSALLQYFMMTMTDDETDFIFYFKAFKPLFKVAEQAPTAPCCSGTVDDDATLCKYNCLNFQIACPDMSMSKINY